MDEPSLTEVPARSGLPGNPGWGACREDTSWLCGDGFPLSAPCPPVGALWRGAPASDWVLASPLAGRTFVAPASEWVLALPVAGRSFGATASEWVLALFRSSPKPPEEVEPWPSGEDGEWADPRAFPAGLEEAGVTAGCGRTGTAGAGVADAFIPGPPWRSWLPSRSSRSSGSGCREGFLRSSRRLQHQRYRQPVPGEGTRTAGGSRPGSGLPRR